MSISFGTDGWRGIIAKDYTFDNLARVADSTARYLKSEDRKNLDIYKEKNVEYREASEGVIIGYDCRFLSEEFALTSARVLQKYDIPVKVSDEPVPTPALSYAVKKEEAAGGIMITASHNPPNYNGFKFKYEVAASAPPVVTDQIEKKLIDTPPEFDDQLNTERVDISSPYIEELTRLIDGKKLKENPVLPVIDPMYGSARNFTEKVLDRFGISSVQIRDENNPGFNGIHPEPLEKYLKPLKKEINKQAGETEKNIVGVVTDGDGDRVSAMDENGAFVDSHRTFSLVMKYLAEERNWKGKAVKNFPLTDMIFKLGEKNDIQVDETPVGFKYIGDKMIKEDVMIGGEESGGIGIKNHIPERDGVLCSLLLLEMVAWHGKPISKLVEDLMEEVGHHYYHRNDISFDKRKEVVEMITKEPPERIGDFEVKSVETLDGVKLRFDDGWLLLRPSGTEPLLRIYCEMSEKKKVRKILDQAENYARELVGGN